MMERGFLFTAQEHKLIGSSVGDKYKERPHTPLGIIDGEIDIVACNKRRLQIGKIGVLGTYWGVRHFQVVCTLEPLETNPASSNYGCTMRDPVLIRLLEPTALELRDRRNEFPFRRQEPEIKLA